MDEFVPPCHANAKYTGHYGAQLLMLWSCSSFIRQKITLVAEWSMHHPFPRLKTTNLSQHLLRVLSLRCHKRRSNQKSLNINPSLSFCFLFYCTGILKCNTGNVASALFLLCRSSSLGEHPAISRSCLPCRTHALWYGWVLIKLQLAGAISLSPSLWFRLPKD